MNLVHQQKTEIKNQEIEINECIKYINTLKNKIHNISKHYKDSFKKNNYLKFHSIAELCDYRIELEKTHYILNEQIKKSYKTLKHLKKIHVTQLNNLVYHEILLNKLIIKQ